MANREVVYSTCKSCHGGCGVKVTKEDGVVVHIEGNPDSLTGGTMCSKGLSSIQHEIEEAAIVDGANKFQQLFYVTIPLLGSTIRTSVYISVLGALQQFGLVWIMSKGGPFGASEMMATYMYRIGFVSVQLARGCAVAVIIMLICLTFSLVYQYVFRNTDYTGGIYI